MSLRSRVSEPLAPVDWVAIHYGDSDRGPLCSVILGCDACLAFMGLTLTRIKTVRGKHFHDHGLSLPMVHLVPFSVS